MGAVHANELDSAALALFGKGWVEVRKGGRPANKAVLLKEVSGAVLRLWKVVKKGVPGDDAAAREEARSEELE
eukprot:14534722-Alexandrium_andersonii.AAC.1